MKQFPQAPFAVFLGAIVGALVLGLLGRAATAGLALATGRAANLSLNGLVEASIVGAVIGGIGGLLLFLLRKLVPAAGVGRGLLAGGALFLVSLILTRLLGRAAFEAGPALAATLGVVVIVYAIYGLVLELLFTRLVEGAPGSHA